MSQASASPRRVTRGHSVQTPGSRGSWTALVDWLGMTFYPTPEDSDHSAVLAAKPEDGEPLDERFRMLLEDFGGERVRAVLKRIALLPGPAGDLQKWTLLRDEDGRPRGGLGYKYSASWGKHVRAYWGGNGDTVHLEVSGQGCRELDAYIHNDWPGFLSTLLSAGVKFTRLDLALDGHGEDALDMETVVTAVQDGLLVSRQSRRDVVSSAASTHESWRSRTARPSRTVYIGAPSSRTRLRIYDKQGERIAAGQDDPGPWTRAELQLRDERAQGAVDAIVGNSPEKPLGEVVASLIAGVAEFVEPSEDTNLRRHKRAAWWEAFLGAVTRLRLASEPVVRTLERTVRWLFNSVAASLSLVVDARGPYTLDELAALSFVAGTPGVCRPDELVEYGRSRRKPWQDALLAAWG